MDRNMLENCTLRPLINHPDRVSGTLPDPRARPVFPGDKHANVLRGYVCSDEDAASVIKFLGLPKGRVSHELIEIRSDADDRLVMARGV